MTLTGLVAFWLYPVAPPRMLPGYHDVIAIAVPTFTSLVETNGAAQFASLPSLHVAWALWVAIALCAVVRRPLLRAAVWLYPVATVADVLATANHYLLDVITAPGLRAAGLRVALAPTLISRIAPASPRLRPARIRRQSPPARPTWARRPRPPARPTRARRPRPPSPRSADPTMPTVRAAHYLPGRHPAISAHRGGSEHAPAGTYAAYQSALEPAPSYLEFDVRRTADGELVAFHPAHASGAATPSRR